MDKNLAKDYMEGLEIAIVIDIEDPEGLSRVRVKRPDFGDVETDWIPTAAFAPVMRPEIGDRVKLGYTGNNIDNMFAIIGDLNDIQIESLPDELRESILNKDNPKYIMGQSGYGVILDDSGETEKVRMVTPDGQIYEVIMDEPNIYVKTNDDISGLEIKLSAKGKITLEDKDAIIVITKEDSKDSIDVTIEGKGKKRKKVILDGGDIH